MSEKFYKDHVVYQIYPRSFCDSNSDGIGDLQGIISKLDYLKNLGVDILWLSPIYPSPNFDYGYDISDYMDINPEYGTMKDFDQLIEQANKREMKIVMDLVVNHTSSEHRWFKESQNKGSPYHDYYIYKKGKKNNKKPPNNWTSNFMGEAWTYVDKCDEWYLHLFAPEQVDLNWKNEAVYQEVKKILKFWYSKGVYGFRCDVINQIYKTSLEDGKGNSLNRLKGGEHYISQEGCHKILNRFHNEVFSKQKDTMVVGETVSITIDQAKRFTSGDEIDMVFSFEHEDAPTYKLLPVVFKRFNPERFKQIMIKWQKNIDWNANYFENHDQLRSIDHYGSRKYHKESGKALGMLLLTLRGTPFIFQGEEIGQLDYDEYDEKNVKDIVPINIKKIISKIPLPKKMKNNFLFHYDRDNARAPFQWDKSIYAGFSSVEPWNKVTETSAHINYELQKNDPDSIFNFYRDLLAYRKKNKALSIGSIEFDPKSPKGVFVYYRTLNKDKFKVIINLNKKEVKYINLDIGEEILKSRSDIKVGYLLPYEAVLIKL
ncbi:MAG: alpha-glucosidase [Bacilli bacterium]|nr:alpha-glucosidase [Bacilli bacterium]